MGNIDYDYWEDHDGSYCPVDPEASKCYQAYVKTIHEIIVED